MKRFFTYLGIGGIVGVGFVILSSPIFPIAMFPFTYVGIPIISTIIGALIGGYWKHNKGAWRGGLIMGFTYLLSFIILYGMCCA